MAALCYRLNRQCFAGIRAEAVIREHENGLRSDILCNRDGVSRCRWQIVDTGDRHRDSGSCKATIIVGRCVRERLGAIEVRGGSINHVRAVSSHRHSSTFVGRTDRRNLHCLTRC